ncbi:hypothetical protein HNQ77_002231 [Silvibacterium bohemicum]|uniref:Restriction endonuclease n=1 Tax=Silvibacterium bohemicum TaxID=1577686 RepID=A0A841JX25_9BACT|nr:hypothetical protein [Silvibacterium bohemicum]MBB6144279.1 hypothetical protein [Silvibacterium bohemicum]
MQAKQRRSREEILESFKACAAQFGRTPSEEAFEELTGIKASEVRYYWPKPSALAEEAGLQPNEWLVDKLSDSEVFAGFAQICLHLTKIPSSPELRIAQRELKTRAASAYKRFPGGRGEFRTRFHAWLQDAPLELQPILKFDGWSLPKQNSGTKRSDAITEITPPHPGLRPFLPAALQYLHVLARGDRPPFERPDAEIATQFERRTADAFRCLGFEVKPMGQGTGRKADSLAAAPRERFGLIIDAKVRSAGYVLGTEDRKFLEYANYHGRELQRQGLDRLYFIVVGPSFRESDLKKLTENLSDSPIRNIILITASALMRMVEESIQHRSTFTLLDLEKKFFGNKIISD